MDSFASRVDKVFGSLQVTSSCWRLNPLDSSQQQRLHEQHPDRNDQEDEKDYEEVPCWNADSPAQRCSFDGMEVEDDLEREGRAIRQMIGLDATLDNEDEEDEFDKAAFGLDGSEDERLYMKGPQETNRDQIPSKSLPLSLYDLKKLRRDPRANHSAARARLEEDAKAATATCNIVPSTGILDGAKITDVDAKDTSENVIGVKRSSENSPASSEAPAASSGESVKPFKRVRFALDPQQEENLKANTHTEFMRHKPNSLQASQVPDYVRNPSKYTCYTLDWSVEDNDESNVEAFKICNEIFNKKAEEVHFAPPDETMQKVQFVRKHDRTTSNPRKISAEEPVRSCIAISRTICFEQLEGENGNLDDEAVTFKAAVDAASGSHKAIEKTVSKSVRNYRTRMDMVDQMEG